MMHSRSGTPASSPSSDDDSTTPELGGYIDPSLNNDDLNAPLPSNSPNFTTDENDNDGMSPEDEAITKLKQLGRRPGLGVTQDIVRPSGDPPLVSEARKLLEYDQERLRAKLVAGEMVMFLAIEFYDDLIDFLDNCEDDQEVALGMVDNRVLFEYYESILRPGRMKSGLRDGVDFVLVKPKTWSYLMEWFGGGPGVSRKCMNENGRAVIDIRGLEIKVKRSSKPSKFVRHVFSKYDTVGTLKREAIAEWENICDDFVVGQYRVWDYHNERCTGRMHPDSAQLISFRIQEGQSVMFEEADPISGEFRWDPEIGEEPQQSNPAYSSYTSNLISDSRRRRPENLIVSQRRPVAPGAVGLSNLGNTCFMNSILQCLSNIWLLRNKFVSDEYKVDINDGNVLGTGGKLANSFGDLMKLLWQNGGDIVSPSGFKSVMAEFKPEFSGYQQHDSQELLSFLLDGLHEDLNRVKKKPVTEPVESKNRSDEEVAEESWRVHHLRNQSFVNDLFEGQYKSTVVCPDCHMVSVTFDPFTMVQLPVSRPRQTKTVSFPVALVNGETGLPLQSRPQIVKVPQECYAHDVKTKACKDADPNDFILCSFYRERFDRIVADSDKFDKVSQPDELIAYKDKNAKRIRLVNETSQNGPWYRPLIGTAFCDLPGTLTSTSGSGGDESDDFEDFVKDFASVEELKSANSGGSASPGASHLSSLFAAPFAEGDVWIGSLESRKYRLRMQVKKVMNPGPWVAGLGTLFEAILDIGLCTSYPAYYYDSRRDGKEEVSYELHGFVPLTSLSQGSEGRAIDVILRQGRFLGSHGSYIGDSPVLSTERDNKMFVGTCDLLGFFAGVLDETKSANSYSSYMSVKSFQMMRVDPTVMADEYVSDSTTLTKSPSFVGPSPPPSNPGLALVVATSRKNMQTIGQPFVFSVAGNITPKGLYDEIVTRLNARVSARLGRDVNCAKNLHVAPDDDSSSLENGTGMDLVGIEDHNVVNDPYGIFSAITLYLKLPGEPPRMLNDEDDFSLVACPSQETPVPSLAIYIEWDPKMAPVEESRIGEALFGDLFTEDGSADSGRGNKLYDCFDMFSEEERLSATETWYCSNCKAHKEAFKKMELWQLPPVLIIHFKRFSQSQMSYYVDKDETEIDFPLENLDLRDRVKSVVGREDCVYDLVAVSHHYGGMGGGHYVAHARNESTGNWYEFDDSSVRLLGTTSQAAASRVKGHSAYVLMYVKRTYSDQKWGANSKTIYALDDPRLDTDVTPEDTVMSSADDDTGIV